MVAHFLCDIGYFLKIKYLSTTNAEEQNREGPNPNNILRAFFCAVDCHDIPSCITLFRYAETAAYQTGQLVQFANALDHFNQMEDIL